MFSLLKRSRKPSPATRKASAFRPAFEALEDRRLLSASAVSNLMNQTVQFNLRDDGHLLMTRGGVQTDIGSGVQGLYQGKDAAGDQVAFDRRNNVLNEYTPSHAWVPIAAADQVTQDAGNDVFFTHGGTLSLATGIPDHTHGAVPILSHVQGLNASGGHTSIQVGGLVKADLTVSSQVQVHFRGARRPDRQCRQALVEVRYVHVETERVAEQVCRRSGQKLDQLPHVVEGRPVRLKYDLKRPRLV
jgi:hypothetical protein